MSTVDPHCKATRSEAAEFPAPPLSLSRRLYAARFRALGRRFEEIPTAARQGWYVDNLRTGDLLIIGALEEQFFTSIPELKVRFDAGKGSKREIGDGLRLAEEVLVDHYPCVYPYIDAVVRFQEDAQNDTERAEYGELSFLSRVESIAITCRLLADILRQEYLSSIPKNQHSPDFRAILWYGERYTFTEDEAKIIELLWEAWEKGTLDVGGEELVRKIPGGRKRVDMILRPSGTWQTLVVPGQRDGTYRLAQPADKNDYNIR